MDEIDRAQEREQQDRTEAIRAAARPLATKADRKTYEDFVISNRDAVRSSVVELSKIPAFDA